MTVLVIGASGQVGGALVRQLLTAGIPTRAMALPSDSSPFPENVEVVRADLADPSSVERALAGIERVFLMTSPPEELPRHTHMVCDVASHSPTIRHVVLLSSMGVEMEGDNPLTTEHREAEEVLVASGIGHTMLRPGPFHSNTIMWVDSIKANNCVLHPFGNPPASPIDVEDIAAVALRALSSEEHIGHAYSLTGPESLTPADQTEILAQVLDRSIDFTALDLENAIAFMTPFAGPAAAEIVAAMHSESLPWRDPQPTVEGIIGHPPGTFRAWAERHANLFREP